LKNHEVGVLSNGFTCPSCGSKQINRTGLTRHGKQNHQCRDCGRQFVLDPIWKALSPEPHVLIDRILLERVSLVGIARSLQISEDSVQRHVNRKALAVPRQVEVSEKPKKRLTVQMDGLWSFCVF
jgi:insertion element IS1 protein InsB